MAKYGMVIDITRCTASYCCFAACKDEYWDNDYPPYSAAQPRHGQFWMNLVKKEGGTYPHVKVFYMPVPCMQCENAPCIKVAKDGAVYKRPDGIVIIDPKKAVGQKQIVDACPYHTIFWDEEKQLPQKCTFCVQRLEEGKTPRCIQACSNKAMIFGDLDDPESEVSKLVKSGEAEVFHPEYNARPNVYYIGLDRIVKSFIAASIVFGDTDDCAENVKATLKDKQTGKEKTALTDNYGVFEFAGLDAGKYSVKLEYAGYAPEVVDVDLKADSYLGYISLVKGKS
jgi:Fe-S-cluster-containing dehydrogenase component